MSRWTGAAESSCKGLDGFIEGLAMPPADEDAAGRARAAWNAVAKPLGSLGRLEDMVVQMAALTGSEQVDISRRCVAVLCADNGVVAQGVSQSGPEVTTVVARNIAAGISSVCRMCAPVGIDCVCVDMGMRERVDVPGIRDCRIAAGTRDTTQGPAMTRAQALEAVRAGVGLVGSLAAEGYRLVGTGEMGIGNTTTAAAMACAFLGRGPAGLVGRGAGLSDVGLVRKEAAIAKALEVNDPHADDPLDVLAKLGGFDIAGLCGMFLGGAVHRVPIVVDGLISVLAAYCAWRMRPECRLAMLPSHLSSEPATETLLERMEMHPVIDAGMHLGEGTGAACLVPLLDMALSLYGGTTFEECGLEPYEEVPR